MRELLGRKILLVEDDIELNETIVDFLKFKGFLIDSVTNGQDAIDFTYEKNYDLILLDVKLPQKNGFMTIKEIREFSNIPVIFITSLNSLDNIENGFNLGGDDYITKPFSLNELYLRINAIVKRVYQNNVKIKLKDNIVFDVLNLELFEKNKKIPLKQKELKLLDLFLKNRDKILSKQKIFQVIYEYNETYNEASLRTFITRLRKVLKSNKIETIKNIGYKFVS